MESNFAALMERTFAFIVEMFTKYNYWLFAIVAAIVIIMIPVNYLVKLAFKNTDNISLQRIRKSISSLMVYVVSIGVLFLFQWLVGVGQVEVMEEIVVEGEEATQLVGTGVFNWQLGIHSYNFIEVAQDTFRVGTLAMVAWWVIKLVVQVGFGPIVTKIATGNEFQKALKEIGLDNKVANSVLKTLKVALKGKAEEADIKIKEYVKANEASINAELCTMLNLCSIDKTKIRDYAAVLTNEIKVLYDALN